MVLKRLKKTVKKRLQKAVIGHATQHSVEQFLYRQADLLDRKQWED